jgi:uncharacterized protein
MVDSSMMSHVVNSIVGVALLMLVKSVQAETLIEAKGPEGPLRGTLLSAETSGAPAVLIIPGSGPINRDGNGGPELQASTYRLIAEGLARSGITSIRIDKRGMFGSASAVTDANAVTISDYVTDVASWIATIRAATKQDCVWVLGHSEGGLVALAAAQKVSNICGLSLIATPGRPLADVLVEQLKSNPANTLILDQALTAIDRLKSGTRVDTSGLHPALKPLFDAQVQGFLIDIFSYDPAKLAGAYKGPVLILQGDKDIQTGVADAERLASANAGAKLEVLSDVNHVLKRVTSEDSAVNVAAYADPNLPLAETVIENLSRFINAQK